MAQVFYGGDVSISIGGKPLQVHTSADYERMFCNPPPPTTRELPSCTLECKFADGTDFTKLWRALSRLQYPTRRQQKRDQVRRVLRARHMSRRCPWWATPDLRKPLEWRGP
jgi:hypothetical protein